MLKSFNSASQFIQTFYKKLKSFVNFISSERVDEQNTEEKNVSALNKEDDLQSPQKMVLFNYNITDENQNKFNTQPEISEMNSVNQRSENDADVNLTENTSVLFSEDKQPSKQKHTPKSDINDLSWVKNPGFLLRKNGIFS